MGPLRCTVFFALLSTAVGQSLEDPRLRHDVWATGIERPLGFDFIGPGELFVFENVTGRVLHVRDGQVLGEVLDLVVGDRGGLGLAVSPNFAVDGFVFLHHTQPDNGQDGGVWSGTRIERRRFDGQNLVDPVLLLEVPFDVNQPNGTNHDSGTLRIGPDDKLYGQLGDKHRGTLTNGRIEQNTGLPSSRCGAIFRLNLDGSIPADNPFASAADPHVRPWFVTGFRNSLGLDFDPDGAALWFSDNGPTNYDELNRATPGMNAGWLKIMGPDDRNATYFENGDTAYDRSDLILLPGAEYRDPEFSWAAPIGVTAVQFIPQKRFPEDLWGDLLLADFAGHLMRFEMSADRSTVELPPTLADRVADGQAETEELWVGQSFGTVTETRSGPDGYLYLTDYYGGHIRRVRPDVDRVEPLEIQIQQGAVQAGDVRSLAGRDQNELVLHRPVPAATGSVRWESSLSFVLNAEDPFSLDLDLDVRTPVGNGQARVELYDPVSGQFVPIGTQAFGQQQQSFVFAAPAPASRWVAAGSARVLARLIFLAQPQATPGSLGSPVSRPELQVRVDRARLRATLP